MKYFYRLFIILLGLLMLVWGITSLSDRMKEKSTFVPFTLYSEVVNSFASLEPIESGKFRFYDYNGREYNEKEFDSILPSFYYRQLVMDNRFPDTLRGRAITPQAVEQERFFFISHPASLNVHTTPLYFLMESMSKRVNLEMPTDVFRLTKEGIEFIDMENNRLDASKSRLFQKVFDKKGVVFPIRLVAGNPTTRKPYDNGYLLLDSQDHLFHLKQVVGQPFLREITLPDGVVPAQLFVTEYSARRHLGFLTDTAGNFYAIRWPDYQLIKAELPPLDMRSEKVTIFGNAFFWTMVQSGVKAGTNGVQYTALEAESLKTVDSLHFDVTNPKGIADYLLPFQLRFTAPEHKYFRASVSNLSLVGSLVWLILLTAITLYYRRR